MCSSDLEVIQTCLLAATEELLSLAARGGIIDDHHLMNLCGRLQRAVDAERQHCRIGVINRDEKRNAHQKRFAWAEKLSLKKVMWGKKGECLF